MPATGLPQVPPSELLKSAETMLVTGTSLSVQLTRVPPGTHLAGRMSSVVSLSREGSSGCSTSVVLMSKLPMFSANSWL